MRRILSISTLLVLCATWTGCVRGDSDSSEGPQGRNMTLTVNVSVPGSSPGGTRAGAQDDDEPLVETVTNQLDMLLLKPVKNDQGYLVGYSYHEHYVGQAEDKSFKFRAVNQDEGEYKAIFIANAHDKVVAALGEIAVGDAEDAVLKKLTFDTDDAWQKQVKSLPMYGSMTGLDLSANMGAQIPLEITMLRAAARVDVVSNVPGLGIAEVRVVNTMNKSSLVPDESNLNESASAVEKPTIVDDASRLGVDNAIVKSGAKDGDVWKAGVTNIYVGEAEAGDTYSERNCVLVNIPQKKEATDDDAPLEDNWYRIDLVDGTAAPRAVLRNHHYTITINSINGPGFEKPEDAFESVTVNVDCEILDWELGMDQDVEFADGYSLNVNRSEVTLYNNGDANEEITVETTYPEGWTLGDKSGWLTIAPEETANPEANLSISANWDDIEADESREGYFWITAGNLKKKIIVTQVNRQGELSLDVTPQTVYFAKNPNAPQVVTATYSPTDAVLTMTWDKDNIQEWVGDKQPELKGNVISLRPKELTDEGERRASLTFTLTSADGKETTSKKVDVIQSGNPVFFNVENLGSVDAGETEHTFKVYSAADWVLTGAKPAAAVTDVDKNLLVKWGEDLQIANEKGADYTVTFPANDTWAARTWFFRPHADHESWTEYEAWKVEQAGAIPVLTVTPSPVDFGAEAEPARIPVKVSTNAKWTYELPADNAWVVGTAGDPYTPEKAPYGQDTPATMNDYVLSFSSTEFMVNGKHVAETTIPAAGEETATVTFKTQAENLADASLQKAVNVTFKRTVPGYLRPPVGEAKLDVYPFELTKENKAGSVTLNFQTNVPWEAGYIENDVAKKLEDGVPAKFSAQTAELAFSSSTDWRLPIPDPNASSRSIRVYVRPQKDVQMAANEPSELYYDLLIDKYYVREAKLTVDGTEIKPDVTQVFGYESIHTAEVKITGDFPERSLVWGDRKKGDLIEASDGATATLEHDYDETGWWGYQTFTVQFAHEYRDDKTYDGVLNLGSFTLTGHDGAFEPIGTLSAETDKVKVVMKAASNTVLPPDVPLNVKLVRQNSNTAVYEPVSHAPERLEWDVYIGKNTEYRETDPRNFECWIEVSDWNGGTIKKTLTVTQKGTKPGTTVTLPDRDPNKQYQLLELAGGFDEGKIPSSITRGKPAGCKSVITLKKGERIKWPMDEVPMTFSNTHKTGPWLFARAGFTLRQWLESSNTWPPKPIQKYTRGPEVQLTPVGENEFVVSNIVTTGTILINQEPPGWYDSEWGEKHKAYVVCEPLIPIPTTGNGASTTE